MGFSIEKSKIEKLKLQQNKNVNLLKIKEVDILSTQSRPFHYKSAKLLSDSGWTTGVREKITSAVTQTKGTLLPEKVAYSFSFDLNISEQFIPYVQMELIARNTPSTLMKGIFSYISTSKREITFKLYDWNGITFQSVVYPSGCQDSPQPAEAYSDSGIPPIEEPQFRSWGFLYPILDFPVPLGDDPSFLLPVAKDFISPNELVYTQCGSPAFANSSWTEQSEIKAFWQVVDIHGLSGAKDVLQYYENIVYFDDLPNFKGNVANEGALPLAGNAENDFYIQDDVSVYRVWTSEEPEGTVENWTSAGASLEKAWEEINTQQLATAKQTRKVVKLAENRYNFLFEGYTLLISPAITQTSWSDLLTPTYEPNGEDIEIKAKIYLQNPSSYNEIKNYVD